MNANLIRWLAIALVIVGLFNLFNPREHANVPPGVANETVENRPSSENRTPTLVDIPYSAFLEHVEKREIKTVIMQGRSLRGQFETGNFFRTQIPEIGDPNLVQMLREKKVTFEAVLPQEESLFFSILMGLLPFFLLIAVWIFFMRQMQGGKGGRGMMGGFGKSKAKLLNERTGRVTFEDVAGVDEAKQELEEIVEFLRAPYKFQRLGGKIPKGVLLVGPPGTGKTLLARAIAGEANVPFFTTAGSEFVEMFVGVGASRVRDMFEQGKKNAPCIIFIDEIDAMGRHRGAGLGGGHDEKEQTLNQLLTEMDGFESNEGVILIAATNRPDVLDPALIRPGRFDRQVVISNPDVVGREKILKVHMKKVPLAPDVDARVIARGTPGFSGADLANLVNEAALLAARRNNRTITMKEFEAAKDKVLMGVERRSMVMTEDEKKLIAYHEAGHAIVTLHVPVADPLHKVTIIPRGRALGVTMSLPERDQLTVSKMKLTSQLAIFFGGRVAESIVFGKDNITTGASNDIERATSIARAMVMEYGMSEVLGPIRYRSDADEVFLGRSVTQQKNTSDETAKLIDEEIKRLITTAEKDAERILNERRKDLETLARGLLEHESLSGEEVKRLLAGEDIVRERDEKETQKTERPFGSVPGTGKRPDDSPSFSQ